MGQGHSYLANGADVMAAGTMKINSQGYVRRITNASGHYTPSVQQTKLFPELLNDAGVRTKNAWLEVGERSMIDMSRFQCENEGIISDMMHDKGFKEKNVLSYMRSQRWILNNA